MTQELKVGDLVQHRTYSKARLRVKKVSGGVVVCERIYERRFQDIKGEDRYPVYIIAANNLVKDCSLKEPTQLTLTL